MKSGFQTSKLYQTDLYDQIKDGKNHIICLAQDGTKTFLLLAAIRNRAHQLHPNFGSNMTIIIEPDAERANERCRMLVDHTELLVSNSFAAGEPLDYSMGQVAVMSMADAICLPIDRTRVNLVILDHVHSLLLQDPKQVQKIVDHYSNAQQLAFICSLIHNNQELSPVDTIQLIKQLEHLFKAKCETPGDLRSLSRQSPITNMDIIEFQPCEMITCDWLLLADSLLKQFCELLTDPRLDNESAIKPDANLGKSASMNQPILSNRQQLVLVRTCMADVIYSLHCLGLWCAKKTVYLWLNDFSRLLQNGTIIGDLISGASTILNCFYGRLDELVAHYQFSEKNDLVLAACGPQLHNLVKYIQDYRPLAGNTWPICIVHVRRRVIAKVLALWLQKVADNHEEYAFIKPNYIVGSTRKHRNRMAVDNFDLHHEAAIRDFRFGNCNVLVTSAVNVRCTDIPRCNLVVSFDTPMRFSDFIRAKGNCRYDTSKYVILLNRSLEKEASQKLLSYVNMERLLNNVNRKIVLESSETALMEKLDSQLGVFPNNSAKTPTNIWRAVNTINKYCTKLPSDSFTRLSPEWNFEEILIEGQLNYYCELRLPINSPVRQKIIGPPAPTKNVAGRLAAFTACKVLHKSGELDDNMMPITKEALRTINPLGHKLNESGKLRGARSKGQPVGSTKHRQFYRKRIADVFSGPKVAEGVDCNLYKIKMVLTCPIPDGQNRRGRRIIDPSETNRNYAIVCTTNLPKICSFPVFTRSGEVMISLELVNKNFKLANNQIKDLRIFHEFTLSKVLKLDKYPTIYDPDSSPFSVLLAPVADLNEITEIDWLFVNKIVASNRESQMPTIEERKAFKFKHEDYIDAVVIPWYRLTDRQQFAYYVAEICTDMRPSSKFPDEASGFDTFVDYYKSKYEIEIFNPDQPVIDVDHTSARLNLLTPRYVNRNGKTLPFSTAKTRRVSRENLVQKQLLIPELCSIHPFPASFWRKAVCLPCIFYRLNSLFLAEELRRKVAVDTKIGFVEPPADYEWPSLNFGWSLKDVIARSPEEEEDLEEETSQVKAVKSSLNSVSRPTAKKVRILESSAGSSAEPPKLKSDCPKVEGSEPAGADFVIDHFDPSKYDIPDVPLDAPAKDWMNIKLISCGTSSSTAGASGWDQPIVQQDIFIEDTNEISWSDCEMEYEGEITERVSRMRCGSPSVFEPGQATGGELVGCSQRSAPRRSHPKLGEGGSDRSGDEVRGGRLQGAKPEPFMQSDESWSLSDEEQADEASEEEVTPYGEWNDNKLRNRPLLRKLYTPTYWTAHGFASVDIASLYAAIRNNFGDALDEQSSSVDHLNTLRELETHSAADLRNQRIADTIINIFDDKAVICSDDIDEALGSWYGMLRQLDVQVDAQLSAEPTMFEGHDGDSQLVVDESMDSYNVDVVQPTFGELLPNRDDERDWSDEKWKDIKFDPIRAEISSDGPGPSIILQALTMSNASDGINLERLETVGDSFLKYSITAYLYCMHPEMHEGKLSFLRSTEISNANLYQLGKAKCLGEIMSATKFEPIDNWLGPGYTVAESDRLRAATAASQGSPKNENKRREIDKALAEVPYDLLLQHSIPDKGIADCVEALIGAYLTASGSRAALLFMKWLGLSVVQPTFDIEADTSDTIDEPQAMWRWLGTPPSPLICTSPSYDDKCAEFGVQTQLSDQQLKLKAMDELMRHYYASNLDKFEQTINYSFRDKAYLVQAFTHNSFSENHVTDCHQRLEFLGDALLDYLITRYLFEDPRCHTPGTLTDLRSALVNNTFFASLAVKYEFHKYLRYVSDELFHVIDGFVTKFRFGSKNTITRGYTLLINEGESECAEDIEVPKALGDVFESVAGAIFLDSGLSLDQVWQVYFTMMKPEIEYFSRNVPKSPIRELLESMPQNVRFSPSELAPDKKHRVIAEVFGLGRFIGVGRNKHSAKSTAAKRALRKLALEQRQREKELGADQRSRAN